MWSRFGANIVLEALPSANAVFDPETGETHFVSELPTLVLQAVGPDPATAAKLIQKIAGPVELDENSIEAVHSSLQQLEYAGLVESSYH